MPSDETSRFAVLRLPDLEPREMESTCVIANHPRRTAVVPVHFRTTLPPDDPIVAPSKQPTRRVRLPRIHAVPRRADLSSSRKMVDGYPSFPPAALSSARFPVAHFPRSRLAPTQGSHQHRGGRSACLEKYPDCSPVACLPTHELISTAPSRAKPCEQVWRGGRSCPILTPAPFPSSSASADTWWSGGRQRRG